MSIYYKKLTEREVDKFIELRIRQLREEGATEDFGISYDAYASKVIYNEKGRRSKKRDALMLEQVKEVADALAEEMNGVIYWDKPLREAVYG